MPAERRYTADELRAEIAGLRPRVGDLARTAGELRHWRVKTTPQRLAGAVAFLTGQLQPFTQAVEASVSPAIQSETGASLLWGVMATDQSDLTRRSEAVAALVGRLGRRPPSPSEVEALQAGLYGLWAVTSLYLSKVEAVLLPVIDPNTMPTREH